MAGSQLIKLPPEALPEVDELTGDMRIVAEVVGVEMAIILGQIFDGVPIRLWGTQKFVRRHRDRQILKDYENGMTGIQLAKKYGVGDRQIWRILGKPEEESRQLSLL